MSKKEHNKQYRLCDCWLDVGCCLCQLKIDKDDRYTENKTTKNSKCDI